MSPQGVLCARACVCVCALRHQLHLSVAAPSATAPVSSPSSASSTTAPPPSCDSRTGSSTLSGASSPGPADIEPEVSRHPAFGIFFVRKKGVFWKRGLFRKVHLLEILENLEILKCHRLWLSEFRDSRNFREPPDSGK